MNIPILPDKLYKLFVLIGAILIVYFWFYYLDEERKFIEYDTELEIEIKSLNFESEYLNAEIKELLKKSENLSSRYTIKNPLFNYDSALVFERILEGDKNSLMVSDSINKMLNEYKYKSNEFQKKLDAIEIKNYLLGKRNDFFLSTVRIVKVYFALGALLMVIGFIDWANDDNLKTDFLRRKNISLPRYSRYCQSCGTSFTSIVKYGINKDNSMNYCFCSECYDKGVFLNPEFTKDDMKKCITEKMNLYSMSKKNIDKMLRRIDKLDRWNFKI